MTAPLLEVENLRITFTEPAGRLLEPVDDVSFQVAPGEWVALIGESGCGKSLTGLAIPQLLPSSARIGPATSIRLRDKSLVGLSEAELRQIRGRRVAMVFQDPGTSLNPVMRIGDQIVEAIRAHPDLAARITDHRRRAVDLCAEVGIADPQRQVDAWPHQLSGGMRQRVMIAMALASEPDLLIADEPTTALDVTVQAQILELLERLRSTHGMAILLITHDLAIVAGRADRALVMYAGRIVETGPSGELFANPVHPYARGLLGSIPRLGEQPRRLVPVAGSVPPPHDWPEGCRFRPRCPLALEPLCRQRPPMTAVGDHHQAACWVTASHRHE